MTPAHARPLTPPPLPAFAADEDFDPADASPAPPPPIVEHPDGFYWIAPDGHQEIGPFASYEEAAASFEATGDEDIAPQETAHEFERESGVADWIDEDAAEPGEGESGPRLHEE